MGNGVPIEKIAPSGFISLAKLMVSIIAASVSSIYPTMKYAMISMPASLVHPTASLICFNVVPLPILSSVSWLPDSMP